MWITTYSWHDNIAVVSSAGDDLIVGLIKNLIYAVEKAIALEIQSFIVLPRTFVGVLWVTLEGSFCCARVFWVRNHTEFLLWGLRRLFSHRLGCIREMSKLVSCHTCLLCPLLCVSIDEMKIAFICIECYYFSLKS